MAANRSVILAQTKDWDPWIAIAKAKAVQARIWGFIDPSQPTKPQELEEPDYPTYIPPIGIPPNVVASPEQISDAQEAHKDAKFRFKQQYNKYEDQRKGIASMVEWIYANVSASNLAFLRFVEPYPWDLLRTLQSRIAPTDSARIMEMERWYKTLIKGIKPNQSIEAWLDEYSQMYPQAKHVGVAEVKDARRALRDFVFIIYNSAPALAQNYELQLDKFTDHEAQHHKLIEEFRNHVRLHDIKPNSFHAFAATDGNDSSADSEKGKGKGKGRGKGKGNNPSFNGNNKPPKCLCEFEHFYRDCFYIAEYFGWSHPKKPANWKANKDKMKKIKDKLDGDEEERKKCEKAIKRAKELHENGEDKLLVPAGISLATFPGVFAANCFLRSSWVLDGASAINLCNDTMAHRFKKDRDCTDGAYVIAGEGPIPIIAYGSITVMVDSPNGTIPMKLSNVSYVPNFMTNLVSEGYLQKKGNLFKDPRANRVECNGKTIIKYKMIGELCVLEDNTDGHGDVAPSSFAAVKSGTTRDWHQLLAHAADDAIQHLQQAAEGVEITDKTKVPLTNECSTCAVSKAHQIISTSSRKSEDSDEPFYRVTYDLIPMSAGLNRHRWVSERN